MNATQLAAFIKSWRGMRDVKTMQGHRARFTKFVEFCNERGTTAMPPPQPKFVREYKAKLRTKKRQNGKTCSTVVDSFMTTLKKVYTEINDYKWSIEEVNNRVERVLDAEYKRNAAPTYTRPTIDPAEIENLLIYLSRANETWKRDFGFLLQMNIVGMCRFHDAVHADIEATLALAKYRRREGPKPALFDEWRKEEGWPMKSSCWALRLERRKATGGRMSRPSWVALGEINKSNLYEDLAEFVARNGAHGGLARKISRKGGSSKARAGSTSHFQITQEAASYSGEHGWSATFKEVFKEANPMTDEIPEQGPCGITPHGLRRLAACLTASKYHPATGRQYHASVSTQVAESAGGWMMNGTTFASTYENQFSSEVESGLNRRMVAEGTFGGGEKLMSNTEHAIAKAKMAAKIVFKGSGGSSSAKTRQRKRKQTPKSTKEATGKEAETKAKITRAGRISRAKTPHGESPTVGLKCTLCDIIIKLEVCTKNRNKFKERCQECHKQWKEVQSKITWTSKGRKSVPPPPPFG
jgi:hypothetical protein